MSESVCKMKEHIILIFLWITLVSGYENLCELGSNDPNECCKLGYDGPFSHSTCFKYYTCLNDRAIEEECPGDSMYKNGTCIPIDTECLSEKYGDEIKKSCGRGEIDPEICCQNMPRYSRTTFKNPKNCRKYYSCFNHKVRSRKCLFKWEFSVKYGICMLPRYAKCTLGEESGSKESPETTEDGSEEVTTTEKSAESNSPVSKDCLWGKVPAEECCKGVQYLQDVLLRNPEDCTTYIQCVHEVPTLRFCPSGLHWNPEANICDWPYNSKCNSMEVTIISHQDLTTPLPSIPSEEPEESMENACMWGKVPAQDCCIGVPYWKNFLLKNPENCDTYIQCVNEEPVVRYCPRGLHWSPKTQCCDWPEAANCQINEEHPEPTTVTEEELGTTFRTSATINQENSSNLETTSNPEESISTEQVSTLYDGEITSKPPMVIEDNTEGLSTIRSTEKPEENTGASEVLSTTMSPGNAEEITGTPEDLPITTSPGNTEDLPTNTGNPEENPATSTQVASTEGQASAPCEDCLWGRIPAEECCLGVPFDVDLLLRNPEDCNTYIQCVHEKPMIRNCPAGLHWNVKANYCDWPADANCINDDATTPKAQEETSNGLENTETNSETSGNDGETTGTPEVIPTTVGTGNSEGLSTTVTDGNTELNSMESSPSEDPEESMENACLWGKIPAQECCIGVPYWKNFLLKNPENCGTYIQCVNEEPVVRYCPSGLHWSPKTQCCDWPETANCQINEEHSEPTTVTEEESDTTSGTSTTNSQENSSNPQTTSNSGESISTEQGSTLYDGEITSKPPTVTEESTEDLSTIRSTEKTEENTGASGDLSTTTSSGNGEETTGTPEVFPTTVDTGNSEGLSTTVTNVITEETSSVSEELSTTVSTGNGEETSGTPEDLPITTSPGNTEDLPTSTGNPEENQATSTQESSTEGQASTPCPCEDCLWGRISAEKCCLGVPFDVDLLLRNPKDCNTYIQCVHEKPMIRNCPEGLHWNVKANYCDWPANANCIIDEPTTPTEQEETSNGLENTETISESSGNTDETNGTPEVFPTTTVGTGNSEGLSTTVTDGNTEETSKVSEVISSTEGTGNGAETTGNTEDLPTSTGNPEENTTASTEVSSTEGQASGPREDCLWGRIPAEKCCLGVPFDVDLLLRNPEDCNTYIQCVHEKPMIRNCPVGLHWNVKANYCDWPANANCINDEATTPKVQEEEATGTPEDLPITTSPGNTEDLPTSTEKPEENPANSTQVTSTEGQATNFETTSNSELSTESSNPTTDGDVPITTPSYWETEDCIFGRVSPKECCSGVPYDVDVLLSNPFNCTTYYQCVHETPMERQCPYGLHWNAVSKYCDWPALAKCLEEM